MFEAVIQYWQYNREAYTLSVAGMIGCKVAYTTLLDQQHGKYRGENNVSDHYNQFCFLYLRLCPSTRYTIHVRPALCSITLRWIANSQRPPRRRRRADRALEVTGGLSGRFWKQEPWRKSQCRSDVKQ